MEEIRYKFGSFILDPVKRLLWHEGQVVEDIYPQDFDILVLLVKNAGQLVKKETLIEQIWNGAFIEDGTLSNAVSEVRGLLRRAGDGTNYIKAVPKKGYTFVSPVTIDDVDKEPADVKEFTETEIAGAGWLDKNKHIVKFIGLELQLPEIALEPKGGLEVNIDRLPESERAGIFSDLARRASAKMVGPEQSAYLDMIGDEYERFHQALDYYGKTSASDELELAVNLAFYWEIRGHWAEGRESLRHALARQGEKISDVKAKALAWFGYFSYQLDDYKTAKQSLLEAAAIARKMGDDATLALALHGYGGVIEAEGQYAEARTILEQSIEASERTKADLTIGWTYRMLGSVAQAQGDPAAAKDFFLKSLAKREEIDDRRGIGNIYSRLSVVAVAERDLAQARLLLDKSFDTVYGTPSKPSVALAQFNLGLIEEGYEQPHAALNAFQRCLAMRLEIGEKRGVARAAEATAKMMVILGREKEAARILGAADAVRLSAAAPLSPTEQKKYGGLRDEAQKKFLNEFEDGRRRVLEDIVVV